MKPIIVYDCPKRARNCRDVIHFVMPDLDPASPATLNGWRSRIKCGMTPFLDSLKGKRQYLAIELSF